ncbi:hypothetical protein BDV28DRAFT_161671 [Aspergillus coremiiformis]|uniref:Uncharacterized protein n=1 Tax=Aspergillus coremiiformis TaxID=138285 RepID=A0A5N6YRA4_9EURO|nr:hypothetical protein BDV28DRAFT_161671 [Aspergillus coremiiformis]
MEPVVESRNRYKLRKALTLMERDIKALEETDTHSLEQRVLKQYRVRALSLSLDTDDSLAPKFFISFALKDMPEPTQEYVGREYNTNSLTLSSERGIGDYNFGNLYRTLEPEFGTLSIIHVANTSRPHIKCIMHNDLDVDDSHLLCREILTVIRIMLGQLKQKVFVNDMVAPVLLFSLNRRHPRAIEAYFDGRELLIRHTKPYDFTFLNAAGFKTFAQWFLGNPIGDTSKRAVQT